MVRLAFILIAVSGICGCYTKLYTDEDKARAEWDDLAYRLDTASGDDTLRRRDSIIINNYYDQRTYRGYPYSTWDDPFFDLRLRSPLRGYWDYYYDPFWDHRGPYPRYHPYPPRYPYGRPYRRPPDSPGNDRPPDRLYPPSRTIPPPERGRRRDGSEEPARQGAGQENPGNGDAEGASKSGPSASPPAPVPRDTASGGDPGIPPPERGRRR